MCFLIRCLFTAQLRFLTRNVLDFCETLSVAYFLGVPSSGVPSKKVHDYNCGAFKALSRSHLDLPLNHGYLAFRNLMVQPPSLWLQVLFAPPSVAHTIPGWATCPHHDLESMRAWWLRNVVFQRNIYHLNS